jgi:hypothetical protein
MATLYRYCALPAALQPMMRMLIGSSLEREGNDSCAWAQTVPLQLGGLPNPHWTGKAQVMESVGHSSRYAKQTE